MDEKLTVPYVALESERARHERERKHERTLWFIVVIVLILLLFGTNAAWINYESSFTDEESTTVDLDVDTANGTANVAGIGDVFYGESTNDSPKDAQAYTQDGR